MSTPRSWPRSLSLLKHHKVRHAYLSLSHQHSQGLDDGPGCWKTTKKPLQLPSVETLRLRPRARACVTAFTCRFPRQQGRLYQRRSGCVKPLQKKSCWYLPLGRSGINLRLRERRLDKVSFPNTAGDCRIPRSTGGNPHACRLLMAHIKQCALVNPEGYRRR